MKKIFILFIALLLSLELHAEQLEGKPVTIELKNVSVSEFARVVYGDMFRKNYFISPDVLADDRQLSIALNGLNRDSANQTIKAALNSVGVLVQDIAGVTHLTKVQQQKPGDKPLQVQPDQMQKLPSPEEAATDVPEMTVQRYDPKNRPIATLSNIAKFAGARLPDSDIKTSTLVYFCRPAACPLIAKTLALVDTPISSISLRAAIVEFSETSDRASSFSLDVLTKSLSGQFAAGQTLANSLTLQGATLKAVLSAIEGDSRFRYVSQPSITVNDGEMASLSVGNEVPVRGSVTTDKNGNPVQAVDYRQSGVVMTVRPTLTDQNVTLSIEQQVSNFQTTTTSNIDSPTLYQRAVKTVLTARRGDVVVLAGLEDEKGSDTSSGLSWLPFLSSSSNQQTRGQLLLVIELGADL